MRTVILLAVGALSIVCHAQDIPGPAARFQRWGDETMAAIRRDFWLAERGLYAERLDPPGEARRQPAFMWGCGVQLSALAAGARVDPARYADQLTGYADRIGAYWHVSDGLGGYDVQPDQAESDRYYDDNAWIVLALVEAFDVTGDRAYLDRAAATHRFVMSGEDDALGGGLYWRERQRTSKNTCANAPAIVGSLLLHQRTCDADRLAAARRLYDWTCATLQDPADGLFWDAVRLDGGIDRRKFTYNSAVMIRANCLLHEITGDDAPLAEARRIARASAERWIDSETGAVRDAGHFAHMLLESLFHLARVTGDPAWRDLAARSVVYVHDELRGDDGRYPNRWFPSRPAPQRAPKLLDQASVARAYFVAADAFAAPPGSPPDPGPRADPGDRPGRAQSRTGGG